VCYTDGTGFTSLCRTDLYLTPLYRKKT